MDVGEDFLIMATFLEIYNEKVFDLCGSNPKDRDKPLVTKDLKSVLKSLPFLNHEGLSGHLVSLLVDSP